MSRSSSPEPVTAVTDLAAAWLPARMTEVERRLGETVAGWGEELGRDAGETLTAGGKRMRPLLVLLCAGRGAGQEAMRRAAGRGYRIGNIDATIVAQEPKLARHLPAMVTRLAQVLACEADQVNLKAKTNERLGYLGRAEGIEAQAVVLLLR